MTRAVHVLGIHDGHNCGATLVSDGKVVASVSEERLTRRKNEVGFPEKSIAEVLRIGSVDAGELSQVVYASNFMHQKDYLTDLAPWYKAGLSEQRAAADRPNDYQKLIFAQRRKERIDDIVRLLGVAPDKVSFVEHHLAHLAAAYYTAPKRAAEKPVLGITCDGAGDGLCATVSVCRGNVIERLASTDRHASIGKIYSRVTFLMGMTPWEHEYKLMGLAPYVEADRAGRAVEPLRKLVRVRNDGLGFEQAGKLSTNFSYEYLRGAFERVRFDTIAAATQRFTEEMLLEWVRRCVEATGISDVVAGGGVFMNVKANMLIAQLPQVTSLYVMPSAGDESLSIGAALHHYYRHSGITDHGASMLSDLYLGGAFDIKDEEAAIAAGRERAEFDVTQPNDMAGAIASLLAEGDIVATCRGRMEWGARALGNRSILSSANDYRRVDVINTMIKMRDFWMPFAPSIAEEAKNRYFDDPKDLKPWFMTFAFPAKAQAYPELIAGAHPRDRTIRPQVVQRAANPGYHAVIKEFEGRTGRAAILNTSFNLHGEPIVYSPADAMRVLQASGLRHLAFDHYLVSKKAA